MSQTQGPTSSSTNRRRHTLSQTEVAQITVAVLKDVEWVKAASPSYADLIRRYSPIFSDKDISEKSIRRVVQALNLGDFVRQPKRQSGQLISETYRRSNAAALVLKRVADRVGVPCDEIDWDTSKSYEEFKESLKAASEQS